MYESQILPRLKETAGTFDAWIAWRPCVLTPALVDLVGPAVRAPPPEADAAPLVDGVPPDAAPLDGGAPRDAAPLVVGAPPDALPLDDGAPPDAALLAPEECVPRNADPLGVGVPCDAPLELPLTLECDLDLCAPLPLMMGG